MARRKRRTPAELEVYGRVAERDSGCVLRHLADHSCFGGLTPHHLRKESQGGGISLRNIVTLCAGGNSWVEDHPRRAHRLGLVVRTGESSADAWRRMRRAGLVTYGPDGVSIYGPGEV